MKLAINQTATFKICADRYWNDTGVIIEPGERYSFSATGKWKDLILNCNADGYTIFYMRLFRNLKRSKENDFFVLMGSIDKKNVFRIGTNKIIIFNTPGKLSCFANDVKGFYWNNFGSLDLVIKRI